MRQISSRYKPTFRSVAFTKAASLLARKVTAAATSLNSPNLRAKEES